MSDPFFSPSWYRVATLVPRIRSHVRFHRHRYRGRIWYVLQDPASGRCHRLAASAYRLVGLMNGERTTQAVWEIACEQLGDDAPSQDETIRLLALLHTADVLRCDVAPDTEELFRRSLRRRRDDAWRRVSNPLALRLPLLDPDAWLDRALPWVRPCFSPAALLLGCAVVCSAAVLAAVHGAELAAGASAAFLAPGNLLLLALVYPLVKALHELGHAFAVKLGGGEVHEIGVMLLVLMPVPYVDASAASVFPDKWRRAGVGAAGIAVELLLASLALFLWLALEPGLLRSLAYDVVLLGTASTLLVNGNPLLRFDGYYVLSDALEIPNLGSRSNGYLAYLAQRYLLGLEQARRPVQAPGEPRWFVAYGLASFGYRLLVLFAIAVFVSGRFFGLGILLAAFAVSTQVLRPLLRGAAFVLRSPRLAAGRPRAVAVSAGLAGGLAAAALLLPVPLWTRAEGVVWPPEGAQLRAGADGFVVRVLAAPGAAVAAGDPLIVTRDPTLEARAAVRQARLQELDARLHAERGSDLVRAEITRDEIAAVAAELARARERIGDVVVHSPGPGTFAALRAEDLPGRYVRQGEILGYVLGPGIETVRVAVPQSDAARVRERTRRVELRLASRPGRVLEAEIRRELPGGTRSLASRALGGAGGGALAVDPADPEGLRTRERVFHFDLGLPAGTGLRHVGTRAHVRFHHDAEPVARRLVRGLRRVFLRHLGA